MKNLKTTDSKRCPVCGDVFYRDYYRIRTILAGIALGQALAGLGVGL